jgi:uncharacterized protein (TIGR03435 family)
MRARLTHNGRTLLLAAVSILLAAAPSALTQTATAQASATTPAFDAVTIKPSISGSRGRVWGFNGDTYTAENAPLVRVILQAYINGPSSPDRLKSAPGWVMDDLYDITAKVDDTTADGWKNLNHDQQMTMVAPLLRAMLKERFNLSVHTESTEISGYALVVSKHGVEKMRLDPPDEPDPKNAAKMTGGGLFIFTPPRPDGRHSTTFVHTTMASLAASIGPTVVDRTGLQGKYDFEIFRIVPDSTDGSASDPQPDFPHTFDWGALGLEIKPIKIPMQDVVIDHIERPSPN